jgi:DNA-binding NarL/FixJ family response regulator
MKIRGKIEMPQKPKRVFLVDQFPISRLAVGEWLKQTRDLALCGEADNTAGALKAVAKLKPDIVVTEILRQQDLGFIESLHKAFRHLPILVFSFRDEAWYAPRALEAGADGYLMKGVNVTDLLDGIRNALEGRVVLSSNMRARLLIRCLSRRRGLAPTRGIRRSGCQTSGIK